uniref:EamA domain-containing protein n=1 Tax=Entomoneis paludosa TaxID=265537 RepID=A0A7S2YTN1_9STRA|mmetsp:Transcript_9439/g.19613  ORF Transcript_9439/g.19613 Transcript_9439/m.19613 type:complete len:553 (+) Transcript_9439:181-1839(+)
MFEQGHEPMSLESFDDETKVAIATLILPSEAVEGGIQSGDGTQVVLEGSPETLEKVMAVPTNQSGNTVEQKSELNAHIEAVIDLHAIAELIPGVTEEEFVEILHQDDPQPPLLLEEDVANLSKPETELTPLIGEGIEDEDKETLILSADPFVDTLSNAMPANPDDIDVTKVETTIDEDENRLGNEAFLIAIPGASVDDVEGGGKAQNTYVLALPEIKGEGLSQAGASHAPADTAHFPFLERAMSELPTDVNRVQLHATAVHVAADEVLGTDSFDEIKLDLVVERKVPVIGFVILFCSLFSLASIGAALKLQGGGVRPLMKAFWRQTATVICLFPFAARKLTREELSKLSFQDWTFFFPLCCLCSSIVTGAFVIALDMTSLANAFILSNLASLIIIASKAAIGIPVLVLEGLGACIGVAGAAICAFPINLEGSRSRDSRLLSEAASRRALIGDAVAILGSFGMAVYLVIARRLRNKLDLFVFVFLLYFAAAIFMLLYILFFSGDPITFSFHPVHGMFGWINLTPDRLPLELWMAIVCNIIGSTGFIAVLKYFE